MTNRTAVDRRPPYLVPLVAGVVAVILVAFLILRPGYPAATASRPTVTCTPIEVSSSSEKASVITQMAADYDKLPVHSGCAIVHVDKLTSGLAEQALFNDWPASTGQPRPQVWLPTSSLWLELLNNAQTSAGSAPIPYDGYPSIAKSPLVMAMPASMAGQLHWPDKQFTWKEIFGFATDSNTWKNAGKPEWGRFTFSKDNPNTSTSGLAATVAMYYAEIGRSADISPNDLTSSAVQTPIHAVENGVGSYSNDIVDTLSGLSSAPLGYTSGLVMQEELIYLFNKGDPTGDTQKMDTGTPPAEKLVEIAPTDGTIMMDHPYVTLPGLTPQQVAAADDFRKYLQEPKQQSLFAHYGFRSDTGVASAGLSDEVHGVVAKPKEFTRPTPEILQGMLDGWNRLHKRAQVLIALDTSGSMGDGNTPGTPLYIAKQAAISAIKLLQPSDEVAIWTFSPSAGSNHHVVCNLTEKRDGKHLIGLLDNLSRWNYTQLDGAVVDAAAYMKKSAIKGVTSSVVLLTDGRNDPDPGPVALKAMEGSIDAIADPNKFVRFYTIAIGAKADTVILADVAHRSKGIAYHDSADNPIDKIFQNIFSNL